MFLYVFWDTKLLVWPPITIVNLLFLFCHDLRKGVFKAVLATVFQRGASSTASLAPKHKKGKLLSQKLFFALLNELNFYFWVPVKGF